MGDTTKGLDQLQDQIKKLQDLPTAFAQEFVKRVQDRTPTRTGLLKDSWEMQVLDDALELRNKATNEEGEAYAEYVEFGTWKEAPALMITTTVTEKQDILKTAKNKAGL